MGIRERFSIIAREKGKITRGGGWENDKFCEKFRIYRQICIKNPGVSLCTPGCGLDYVDFAIRTENFCLSYKTAG